MKKILYSILFICILTACESTTKNFGQQFTVKNPLSVDEVLTQMKQQMTLKDIQIVGKIEKSCMSEGCWFTIKDAEGTQVLLDVKDKKFKVPTNSPGKNVVIITDVERTADKDTLEKLSFQVKGLMFK